MTMPKKGRREIMVGGTKYHYIVRGDYDNKLTVVIQNTASLRLYTHHLPVFEDGHYTKVTPAIVKDVIEDTGL